MIIRKQHMQKIMYKDSQRFSRRHQHVGGPQVAVRQAHPVQVPQPRRPARRVPAARRTREVNARTRAARRGGRR